MTRTAPLALVIVAAALLAPRRADAQIIDPPFPIQPVAGVYVDAEGTVRSRQTETASDLAAQRLRAKTLANAPKNQALTYVSLNKLFAEVRALTEQGKPLPDDLRYLSGLTSIRYVFAFPEDQDLVIAGPSEPFDATNPTQPIGKLTGRPVVHLDDLVTALRLGLQQGRRGAQPFGCSIDPHPDSMTRSTNVMKEHARSSRAVRMAAMKDALGPQDVRMFGAPADSRLAFVTLAADYKLKRFCLGLDSLPVPGIGSAVDATRAASNRFWFEADYKPLLVSPDADAFEIRGPRLTLKCGAFSFDPKGATDTAKAFTKRFADRMPQLATTVPAFADLQNVTDLALVAALIRQDRLADKTGLDLAWILSPAFKTRTVPTPRNAETLVHFTSGSIVAGGVSLDLSPQVAPTNRERDADKSLSKDKSRPTTDWRLTRN